MASIYRENLLEGKSVLVTGGGSGIGLETARFLMQHGANIAILGRSLDRLKAAKIDLETTGRTCIYYQCDIRNLDQINAAVDYVIETYKKIDVLINNAAGNFLAPFTNLTTKGFRTVLEIDTIGTFSVTKTVFDKFMKAHGGSIINISSTLQMPCVYMISHAAAAKAAIDSLTRSLAMELGPYGVRVNAIAPGPIEGTEGMSRLSSKEGPSFEKMIPLQRYGTKKEIAEGILYLISAQWVTGINLIVDGGQVLTFPNFSLGYPGAIEKWSAKL